MAAKFFFLVLCLTIFTYSDATWCVCRQDASNSAMQKALDYACGAGADCKPILQNGPCYNPNTVLGHCSYAANSYFQNNGQTQLACEFSGTATITSTDPSNNGCTYPATRSASGSSSSAGAGASTQNPSSMASNTNGLSPTQTGAGGGVLGGLGPSGTASTNLDGSDAGFLLNQNRCFMFLTISLVGLNFLRL